MDKLDQLRGLILTHLPAETAERYLWLLADLHHNILENGEVYLGLQDAPAAKSFHHNHKGGWLDHVIEMWDWWQTIKPKCEPMREELNDARILMAIINHDLHKTHRTFIRVSEDPWQVRYADDTTDLLMTKDIKSLWLLNNHGIQLDPLQMNALICSEGGWSDLKPRWTSVLAKTAYLLDELSGNVQARIKDGTYLDPRQKPRPIDPPKAA